MKRLDISMIGVFDAASSPSLETLAPAISRAVDEKGVVLLRGFNPDLLAFEALSYQLCDRFHVSPARIANLQDTGDQLTTGAMSRNYTLFAHGEGKYSLQHAGSPELAFFMCIIPPSVKGGETTVIDGAAFYDRMPPHWQERFKTIVYEMLWDKSRWQYELSAQTVEELKAALATFPNVKYTLDGEMLHLFHAAPGITRSRSGHNVFVPGMLPHLPRVTHPNYADKKVHAIPTNHMHFGDGEEMSDEIINGLIDIHDAILYAHVWQKGDILILDNTRYMHGRTVMERDCERKLMTRFGWVKQEQSSLQKKQA